MKRRSSQANILDSSTKATGGYTFTHVWYDCEISWSAYRATPLGIVDMEATRFSKTTGVTLLIFFHAGRRWERQFDKFYEPLWAARLATEFARDVVEGVIL
jgi:hypothetical protein